MEAEGRKDIKSLTLDEVKDSRCAGIKDRRHEEIFVCACRRKCGGECIDAL